MEHMEPIETTEQAGTVAFFRARQAVESALTAGVLQALPAGRLDYKPHPRSPSAAMIETVPLERAPEAYRKMMRNEARFRMVIEMS
jgi:hypothetical protein